MKKFLLYAPLLIVALSGCMATDQQRAKWRETTPVCYSKPDCDVKWSAARRWVQENVKYKIRIYSDDFIETYGKGDDPEISVSVAKNPTQGGHTIDINVTCGMPFIGCVPSIDSSVLSFNNYVRNR